MGQHEPDPPEAKNLKGLSKHFNSITFRGRANISQATFAVVGLLGLYAYFKPKKTAAPAPAK